jgi:tRNA(Ile)-lysidine synthase TilS/MesJ
MNALDSKTSFPSIMLCMSGGQDSMTIWMLLMRLRQETPILLPKFGILHCQHGWTSQDLAMATEVTGIAEALQIPCYVVTQTRPFVQEEAARLWRYSAASRIAHLHGYELILTAHTGQDRVESFLLHLIRGTGLRGIMSLESYLLPATLGWDSWADLADASWAWGGIDGTSWRPVWPLSLGRPGRLLERAAVTRWLQKWHLPIFPDPTHQRHLWARNRLRYELLPYLAHYWNPNIEPHIQEFLDILEPEIHYLEMIVVRIQDLEARCGPLLLAPPAIQKNEKEIERLDNA